jgi:hypothetical protein
MFQIGIIARHNNDSINTEFSILPEEVECRDEATSETILTLDHVLSQTSTRRIWKPSNFQANRKTADMVDHPLDYVQETVAALQAADMLNAYSSHANANSNAECYLCVTYELTGSSSGFINIAGYTWALDNYIALSCCL